MELERHVVLPDGRKLAYAEFGEATGRPVLYFHGSPSCRLEPMLVGDEVLRRLELRVIAPDRPGIGGSTPQPRRRFGDWPRDVAALADALELQQFTVIGNSGGAPYAAVCAARIPDRLRAALIVSGGWQMTWPEATQGLRFMNRLTLLLARRAPLLLRLLYKSMAGTLDVDRNKQLAQMRSHVAPTDYVAFAEPGRVEAFGQVMRETMRQGTAAPVQDMRLYVREFDFALTEVRMPITFFHGDQDQNAPIALPRRVVAGLPSANLVTYPGEAHLSTLCNHFEDVARAIPG